jgi:hypothetical protein
MDSIWISYTFPMDSYGIPMDSYGFLWIPIGKPHLHGM